MKLTLTKFVPRIEVYHDFILNTYVAGTFPNFTVLCFFSFLFCECCYDSHYVSHCYGFAVYLFAPLCSFFCVFFLCVFILFLTSHCSLECCFTSACMCIFLFVFFFIWFLYVFFLFVFFLFRRVLLCPLVYNRTGILVFQSSTKYGWEYPVWFF